MIEFSFALIVFSILPIVLFNFEFIESTVWTVSSATMAIFIPCHMLVVGGKFIMPAVRRGEFGGTGPLIIVPLFCVIFAIQATNALGYGFDHSFAAYFLGLASFILMAFSNFMALLIQFWISDK